MSSTLVVFDAVDVIGSANQPGSCMVGNPKVILSLINAGMFDYFRVACHSTRTQQFAAVNLVTANIRALVLLLIRQLRALADV